MKFETLMLGTLFAACLLVSGLILGAMLIPAAPPTHMAAGITAAALLVAPTSCALPSDRVACPSRLD